MSKQVAVVAAVTSQLRSERKWPPNNLNKVMGADYLYTLDTIADFLDGIAARLSASVPAFTFEPDKKFSKAALKLNVTALTRKIVEKTV